MKTQFLILTFFLTILFGCKNYDDNYPYYEFKDSDKELIISYDYQIGQIITYENQFGEQLHFKVIENATEKTGYYEPGTISGGGGYLGHYYDSKIIRFKIIENHNYNEIYGLVNYIFSKNNDTFSNGINLPMWNVPSAIFMNGQENNHINIPMTDHNNEERIQISINNQLFNNVVSVESESEEVYINNSYGTITKNVNKIYFDYDFGIIQFNDIEGNKWKVIYPE